jgi:hypothetical protein
MCQLWMGGDQHVATQQLCYLPRSRGCLPSELSLAAEDMLPSQRKRAWLQ